MNKNKSKQKMSQNIFSCFRGALIDMDGVLYDSMKGHTLAWKRMMDGLGVECTRDEFYLYEGMTGIATVNFLFNRAFGHGCSREKALELYEIKSRYFKELGPAVPMPDADRMTQALKKGGLDTVLVTGSGQLSLLKSLDRDYPGVFPADKRVTALDVNKGKPDPEPYLAGAQKAGISPSEAIVIENAPLGVRAGKAAGCFTIAVTTGPIPRKEFEKEGADLIFDSMSEFADFVEEQLQEYQTSCLEESTISLDTRIAQSVKRLNPDLVFILTDRNVATHVKFDRGIADSVYIMEAGEAGKNLETLGEIWRWLMNNKATRNSLLINLGGGVVSDLGGFAAATYKRGIRYINVPTTLLAAADASIGGKTGIDFEGVKNLIGAFAMPEDVIVVPSLFKSLPRKEQLSGFAEVVKMALLNNESLFARLMKENAFESDALMLEAVMHAADCKREIVKLDPLDKGLRRILNFGHTAGHAFEAFAMKRNTPISHGEAVAQGILISLQLSVELTGLPQEVMNDYLTRILNAYYSPLPFNTVEHGSQLLELMLQDKKNATSERVNFVLLERPGVPVESVEVTADKILTALSMPGR